MKSLTNINARTVLDAVNAAQEAINAGQIIADSCGGTDLLQQIKDGTADEDVVINLRNIEGADQIIAVNNEISIGGLITLDQLSTHSSLAGGMAVLAQAAASVGTPQIRNVATLAGNVTQRPWCW